MIYAWSVRSTVSQRRHIHSPNFLFVKRTTCFKIFCLQKSAFTLLSPTVYRPGDTQANLFSNPSNPGHLKKGLLLINFGLLAIHNDDQQRVTSLWTCRLICVLAGHTCPKVPALLAQLDARPTGDQEVAGTATYFHGDWSWNMFYGHYLPSALSLGDDTKWPTRVDMSLNPNTISVNW